MVADSSVDSGLRSHPPIMASVGPRRAGRKEGKLGRFRDPLGLEVACNILGLEGKGVGVV